MKEEVPHAAKVEQAKETEGTAKEADSQVNIKSQISLMLGNHIGSIMNKRKPENALKQSLGKAFKAKLEQDAPKPAFQQGYYLNRDQKVIIELLADMVEQRGEGKNIIDLTIEDMGQEMGIFEDKEQFQVLKDDLMRFIDRRSMTDAFLNSQKNTHDQEHCHVLNKSLNFLTGNQLQHQAAGSERDIGKVCDHTHSEEDHQIMYLKEYQRFLHFSKLLQAKLKQKIPNQFLVASLLKDVAKLDFSAEEKKIFSTQESIQEMLKNPLLEIALSIQELDKIT